MDTEKDENKRPKTKNQRPKQSQKTKRKSKDENKVKTETALFLCVVGGQYTYTPLIHAYTKTYQWKAADAVLDRVIEEGIKMWSSLPYVSLIRCFRSTRKWELMERAYTAMLAEGFELPEVAWKFLLEGFAWAGEMVSHRNPKSGIIEYEKNRKKS